MRRCLMLDLKDSPDLIAEYEAMHREIWPEVANHLRTQGITRMEIFRLGTRLCMLMETDDSIFSDQRVADAEANDPVLTKWQSLMWKFQAPTPWTPPGEKWVEAALVFDLSRQP
ncbi:L-rhamnose mutarotase [Paraburkholderia saeva]|uniref:L-fucose mutarotase n=1 Tax=Paraburkholderia saeva TaxID=2777537 RepID=A0A9N8RTI2_9BURK|nr:L-rhamnose mutarotase [Paraburkholderia saeva]CAG4889958.1 L-fucose mutarotase [Paraburkholderia saeva]CAG4922331.1 L-fucose mutarotase [Paraburkholderia saeva]CAG4924595.1 L-fucose mutarotase [Paraburkholderia saeva]